MLLKFIHQNLLYYGDMNPKYFWVLCYRFYANDLGCAAEGWNQRLCWG